MSVISSIRSQLAPIHPEGYPFIGAFALVAMSCWSGKAPDTAIGNQAASGERDLTGGLGRMSHLLPREVLGTRLEHLGGDQARLVADLARDDGDAPVFFRTHEQTAAEREFA